MNKAKETFALRQIFMSIERGSSPKQSLEQVMKETFDENTAREATTTYNRNQSLVETLDELSLLDVSQEYRDAFIAFEKAQTGEVPLQQFYRVEKTINETIQLMRMRLMNGLVYSLWLLGFAIALFYLVTSKITPLYEEIFSGFGADLPAFTRFMFAWQNSIVSPLVLAILVFLLILFLVFKLKTFDSRKSQSAVIGKLPFLNRIKNFIECLNWTALLRLYLISGESFQTAVKKAGGQPSSLGVNLPDGMEQIESASAIGNGEKETEYQIGQLEYKAEFIVSESCRRFIAGIMAVVVAFVAAVVIATYSPIFSFGAVI